jgi:hypothetical protein
MNSESISTRRIVDGQTITVDGSAGTVTLNA